MGHFELLCLRSQKHESGGRIRTCDLRVMSLSSEIGWTTWSPRAVCARSNYVEIGWNLWGLLPHLLPQLRTDEWQDAPLPLLALSESPYVGCEARGRRRRLPSTRQLSAAASRAFLILSRSLACGRPEVSEKSILLQSRCARTEFSRVLWPPSRFGIGKCSWVGFQSLYLVTDSKCEAPPSSSGQRHLGIPHFTSVM